MAGKQYEIGHCLESSNSSKVDVIDHLSNKQVFYFFVFVVVVVVVDVTMKLVDCCYRRYPKRARFLVFSPSKRTGEKTIAQFKLRAQMNLIFVQKAA